MQIKNIVRLIHFLGKVAAVLLKSHCLDILPSSDEGVNRILGAIMDAIEHEEMLNAKMTIFLKGGESIEVPYLEADEWMLANQDKLEPRKIERERQSRRVSNDVN